MKVLDKYIAKEMVSPFILGVSTFLLMLLGNILFALIDIILQKEIPIPIVAKLLFFKLPALMVNSLPVATLVGASMAINRMSRDSEITAMRIGGLSLKRIFAGVLAFGLLISFLDLFINEKVVPVGEHIAQNIVRQMYMAQATPDLQPDVFFNSENYYFYIHEIQKVGKKDLLLKDVMIYELGTGGRYPVMITAKEGSTRDNVWHLRKGVRHQLDNNGFSKVEVSFDDMVIDVHQAMQQFWSEQRTSNEMGMSELKHQIDTFGKMGIPVRSMEVDFYFKLAIPLSCLVFALCSAPLGLKFSRSGSFMGILLSIVIGFLYINTMFLSKALGSKGYLPPVLGAWAPNIIFTLVGLYFIWKEE